MVTTGGVRYGRSLRQPARLSLVLLLLLPAVVTGETWQVVSRRQGISVSQRQGNNGQFPTFRGVATVRASLLHVVAILTDVGRHPEWMFRCVDSRIVGQVSDTARYVYNRTDSPWPVADRDVLLLSSMTVAPDGVTIRFRSTTRRAVPVPGGTVRMTRFQGHYRMTELAPKRTRVEYQITADPAGRLPSWLVEAAVRRLPRETLRGLQRQAAQTGGVYAREITRLRRLRAALLEPRTTVR